MYKIDFSASARGDLKTLRKFEQKQVLDGIETQLSYEPTVETRNRKQLDPNEIADWELRISKFRVFYNVDEQIQTVNIEAVGLKIDSMLFIRGERREL